jgi:hypothetical protein
MATSSNAEIKKSCKYFICLIKDNLYRNALKRRLYLRCRGLVQNKFLKNLRYYTIIFFGCFTNYCIAQTNIKGTVTDNRKHPVPDASVYIKGTMNVATTDSTGHF